MLFIMMTGEGKENYLDRTFLPFSINTPGRVGQKGMKSSRKKTKPPVHTRAALEKDAKTN